MSSLLPFDGTCEASRTADFTLLFDSGEPLRAHVYGLALASPVLKTALEDCRHDGVMHVGSDNRAAWLVLLHFLHPSGFCRLNKHLQTVSLCEMEAILCVAKKYDMSFVAAAVDEILQIIIEDKMIDEKQYGNSGVTALNKQLVDDKPVLDLFLLCVDHGLQSSMETCKEYIRHCLFYGRGQFSSGLPPQSHGGLELAGAIRQLMARGHSDEAASFGAYLIETVTLTR